MQINFLAGMESGFNLVVANMYNKSKTRKMKYKERIFIDFEKM